MYFPLGWPKELSVGSPNAPGKLRNFLNPAVLAWLSFYQLKLTKNFLKISSYSSMCNRNIFKNSTFSKLHLLKLFNS